MKLLLDTHLLLWAAEGFDRLPPDARLLLADPANHLLFSAASIWEVVIKRGLGRKDFLVDPAALHRGLLNGGYIELPVSSAHALAVGALPPLHKDPFDRLLIAQAIVEKATLLTADTRLCDYSAAVRRV